MRQINRIILHCSASQAGVDLRASDILRYHTNPVSEGGRGWKNPGYHYVVELSGAIRSILPEARIANGVRGHNATAIHVCYVGGLRNGKPANTLTPRQRQSIVTLLKDLHSRYPEATLHGHNEFANKACPCFRVADEFKRIL